MCTVTRLTLSDLLDLYRATGRRCRWHHERHMVQLGMRLYNEGSAYLYLARELGIVR